MLRHYLNLFQPTMKLVSKTRPGAKVHQVYDPARTPYQRLLEAGVLTEAKQAELAAIYHGLNPVLLLKYLNGHRERLWKLADRTTPKAKAKDEILLVTGNLEATTASR